MYITTMNNWKGDRLESGKFDLGHYGSENNKITNIPTENRPTVFIYLSLLY